MFGSSRERGTDNLAFVGHTPKGKRKRKQPPRKVGAARPTNQADDLKEENAALKRELAEALEYQTATSDVLGVISRSAFDLQPVLDTLIETAARLCNSDGGGLAIRDGEVFRYVGFQGETEEFRNFLRQRTFTPGRDTGTGRVLLEGKVVHIPDVAADPDYAMREMVTLGDWRTYLGVPLLRERTVVGVITLNRRRAEPFTERQIELVRTFAAQAVIAMENARLLGELRERQAELARSVDELTATGDVLKIISRSSVDLETVLDTLVETVGRLCRADQAAMFRRRDDAYHLVASRGVSEEAKAFYRTHSLAPDRGTSVGRVTLERRAVHIPDVLQDPDYTHREGQKITGYRTILGIPLLREDTLVGIY